MNRRIAEQRLANQRITAGLRPRPEDVVSWFGAVQAQDYAAAKWALALRMRDGATGADVDRAFDAGRILRTHVLRPTWHFVSPSDVRWMLDLTAAAVHRRLASVHRRYGLEQATCTRAAGIFERALASGAPLTRAELGARLARAGIAARGVALALLTVHAELEGIVCSGPRRGTQMTYALLAERAPRARLPSRDEALAELAARYLRSHAPATLRDFVWWSGLATADAKRGLEAIRARRADMDGRTYWSIGETRAIPAPRIVHLLPVYDEYLVAYRDWDAVPRKAGSRGKLDPALVAGGEIVGAWRTVRGGGGAVLAIRAERRLSRAERRALDEAAARYALFLGMPVSVSES